MKIELNNKYLKVQIDTHGAEMTGIYHKDHAREYLCPKQKPVWQEQAPILFPFIGNLKEGYYLYKGKAYSCGTHGFARNKEFALLEAKDDQATFALREDADTLSVYPFYFELRVRYLLDENRIRVETELTNRGQDDLFYAIGFHPGFRCPMQAGEGPQDYALVFEPDCRASKAHMKAGCIEGIEKNYFDGVRSVPISRELFEPGALILTELSSKCVSLRGGKKGETVCVELGDYPQCALWSPEGREVEYVCVEPRYGLQDFSDSDHLLERKPGMIRAASGEAVKKEFGIIIG